MRKCLVSIFLVVFIVGGLASILLQSRRGHTLPSMLLQAVAMWGVISLIGMITNPPMTKKQTILLHSITLPLVLLIGLLMWFVLYA